MGGNTPLYPSYSIKCLHQIYTVDKNRKNRKFIKKFIYKDLIHYIKYV